jgi:arsenate reductase-like glutaredoxin family protein
VEDMENIVKDNEKLREFVQRQGEEIRVLQQGFRDKLTSEEFRQIYQQSQDTIERLEKENQELRQLRDALQ